jgi:hypothetical protein
MNIKVCCPSWKRPKVETLKYLPFCRVYVDDSEHKEYCKQNTGADIIKCPKGIQGNLCRVRNYILDQEFQAGADVVLIIDDDMRGIFYHEHRQKCLVPAEDFLFVIEKFSIMAKDIGAYFWGLNCNEDPQSYRENTPFSTLSYIGGPFQCFLKGNTCYYDERLPLKEDYDMTLQQLNKHRIIFRVNKYFYDVKQSKQAGGCAAIRNLKREKQQLELLKKKWGNKIVRIDTLNRNHRTAKKRTMTFDYNPVIRAPIKGL